MRERTFFPRPALIQLNNGLNTSLFDATADLNFDGFAQLLGNASIVKVMHAASEDLQVFDVLCSAGPVSLFDTQIAAAFAGHGPSVSYHALVNALCGVTLDKSQTRSDWMRRPLSSEQLRYAADDVAYLPQIHTKLSEMLEIRGFIGWCAQETSANLEDASLYPQPEQSYQRVKGTGRLSAPAQHRLRDLCNWREHQARRCDLPRNRIAKDAELLNLCATPCRTLDELKARVDLHPAALRRFGEALLGEAQAAFERHPERGRVYQPLVSVRDTRKLAGKIKALREQISERATALDIPATLLGTNKDIEDAVVTAVENGPAPRLFTGWRAKALNLELDDIAQL